MCQCCQCLCLFSDNVSVLLVSVPVFRQRVNIVGVSACFQTTCHYCWCLCLFSDNVSILLVSMPVFRQRVNIVGVYACFQTMCQYCWCLCLFSDNVSILLVSMPVFRQHVSIVGVYAGFQTTCRCTAMRVATRSAPTSSWRLTCCSVSSPRLTARRKPTRWAWGDCPVVDVGSGESWCVMSH